MAAKNIESFPGQVEVTSNLTVDTNTLHVDSETGRVGIGKTNPGYTMDVNGIVNATSLYVGGSSVYSYWSSNISNVYYTTGAVGIGTDFPKKDLEVAGTLRLSNLVTGTNTDLYVAGGGSGVLVSTTPIQADGTILSFTGQHTCFPEGPMEQGRVVSANKNKYVSLNGPLTTGRSAIRSSESLPIVSLSNVANDGTVFGVVDRHENGGTIRTQVIGVSRVTQKREFGDNRVIVNSLGEGAMWVANTNGPLKSGDYITTSNIVGYGQRQDDDVLHSYTVAKITMDCNFDPEDVPVQVVKKDEGGNNVLDSYGRIQWEEVPDQTKKAYMVRYLTTNGNPTDEANAVHIAAYVGCTYHCG